MKIIVCVHWICISTPTRNAWRRVFLFWSSSRSHHIHMYACIWTKPKKSILFTHCHLNVKVVSWLDLNKFIVNFCEYLMNYTRPPPSTISRLICNLHNFRVCFYHFLNRKEQIKTIVNFHSCFLLLLLLSSSWTSEYSIQFFPSCFYFSPRNPSDLSKWKSVACMRNTLRSFFLFIWFSMLNFWIHFLIVYTIFIRINLPKKRCVIKKDALNFRFIFIFVSYESRRFSILVTPHFAVLWKVEWKQWFWFVRMTWTRFICDCFYY